MENEQCDQPTGRIDLQTHERVVCIGDVHGDLFPFLECMVRAKLIRVPEQVMLEAQTCHVNQNEKERSGYPITRIQAESIEWIGKTSVVVFTGDVLDNRRSSNQDRFGVCAKTGTQQMMIFIIWLL